MPIGKGAGRPRVLLITIAAMVVFCASVFLTSAQEAAISDRFYQAIRTNDLDALQGLVAQHGANVKDSTGLTPLILAAAFGTKNAVNILLGAGADVKAASNAGLTALHVAWQ